MAARDSFLMRVDPALLNAVRQWAEEDLRSVNGQIEFLLRRSLRDAGRSIGKSKPDGGKKSKKKRPPIDE